MKKFLLSILCLLPVVTQSETICKTDNANGITRCKDSNGVETRWKSDSNGHLRSNTGEKWKQDSHGKWRDNFGTVISKDANGIIRDNKGNTWRLDAHNKLRGSDGSICKKDPHGSVRCKE